MDTLSAPLTLAEAVERYHETVPRSRNQAERTRLAYRRDLQQLLAYLEGKAQLTHIDQVQRKHLEGFLAELDHRGLKGSSRRRKVAALRSFFGFLEQHDYRPTNPASMLIPPAREHHEPRVLSEAEYTRLRDAVRFEVRDAAIIEFLLQTGMRLSELSSLKLTDIELPAKITRDEGSVGRVTIQGKGRKVRTVTLNWKACRAVKSYLQQRPTVATPYLFLTKFKKPIGPRSIENLVTKHLTEAGIPGASVHSLRHTFATHQAKKGTKLKTIKEMLGHSNLATTSIYVALAREEMDRKVQQNAL
ncbi:MAG TPA: tyrosine-type recombinase/integrase [Acidimicrobiales bacterium]|nr:tyrosine-type recombinase/integrase [Acidimicrobiales bacterium]